MGKLSLLVVLCMIGIFWVSIENQSKQNYHCFQSFLTNSSPAMTFFFSSLQVPMYFPMLVPILIIIIRNWNSYWTQHRTMRDNDLLSNKYKKNLRRILCVLVASLVGFWMSITIYLDFTVITNILPLRCSSCDKDGYWWYSIAITKFITTCRLNTGNIIDLNNISICLSSY